MVTCDTLYELSLQKVATNLKFLQPHLPALPNQIKCHISFTVQMTTGIRDPELLKSLVNRDIQTLELLDLEVTNSVLEDLQTCKRLRKLVLPPLKSSLCNREALHNLVPHLSHLEDLQLRKSFLVDDTFVHLLAKHCPRLTLLDLGQCVNITDEAMKSMTQMRLRKLNICQSQITDGGLEKTRASVLANHLEELNIKQCKITCVGLNYLRWDKIKFIQFEVNDNAVEQHEPEPKKGTGQCWFWRDIVIA